jgi:hypothetical protein
MEVPIKFVPDTTLLEPALAALSKLGVIADDELEAFKATNEEFRKRTQLIQQAAAPMEKLADSADKASKNLASDATNKLIEDLEKKVESLTKKLDEQGKTGKASGAALENSVRGMRQRYNELVAASNAAFAAGNRALGDQLRREAADTLDAINDLRSEVRNLASDSATLDGLLQAVTSIGAGMQVAQGTTALLGDESEDLNKILVQLQATMAVVSGLQQIQNALQADSSMMLFIKNARLAVTNALERIGITIKLQAVAVTRAEAAANASSEITYRRVLVSKTVENALNSKSIIVRGLATAAQWALNNAMLAFPLVAIVAGLAILVAALSDWRSESEKAAANQIHINNLTSIYLDLLDATASRLRDRGKLAEDTLTRELALLTAQGASSETLRKKEAELAALKKKNADEAAGLYSKEVKNIESNQKALEALTLKLTGYDLALETIRKKQEDGGALYFISDQKRMDDLTKKNLETQREALNGQIEVTKRQIELGQQARDEQLAQQTELKKLLLEQEREITEEGMRSSLAAINAKLRFAREGSAEQLALQIAARQKEAQIELFNTKLTAGERMNIEADLQGDLADLREQYAQRQLNDQLSQISAQLAQVRRGSQEEFELTRQQLEVKRELELTNHKLTEAQRQDIVQKSLRAITELEKDWNIKRTADQLNTERLLNDAKLVLTREGSAENLSLRRQQLDIQEQLDLNAIDKDIQGTALGEAQKQAIRAKYQADRIQLERDSIDAILERQQAAAQAQADYFDQLAQIEASSVNTSFERRQQIDLQQFDRKLAQLDSEANIEAARFREGIITYEEYQKRLTQINNDEALTRLQKEEAIAQQLIELRNRTADKIHEIGSQSLQTINQFNAQESEEVINNLNNQLAAYTQMKENEQISEEQFAAKKKELDERIRKEKRRAAEQEKQWSLVQILLDTGVAATKALAVPPAPNVFAAGLATAFGLAQYGLAASRKIPGFAKGTENAPPGWAWVGEKGPELMWLRKGDKIKSHEQSVRMTAQHIEQQRVSAMAPLLSEPRVTKRAAAKMDELGVIANMDPNKLASLIGQHVGQHIASMPITNVQIDENGFAWSIVQGQTTVKVKKVRYN